MEISYKKFETVEMTYPFVSGRVIRELITEQEFEKASVACRINMLSMIKHAGSGHIGSSFSAIDLVLASRLFLNSIQNRKSYFFSSKGHDAPAVYAGGHALGDFDDESIFTLRRLNGLPGHPEIHIKGVPTNTGSLGMGISKAKGFVHAARLSKLPDPEVIVILGDGELQEGQIWESMPGAARDKMQSLIAIVDGNKIQSDTWIEMVNPLQDLKMRVEGSGWQYLECDGHDVTKLIATLKMSQNNGKPRFIYAHTVKASGVSHMSRFSPEGGFFKFHSGAPSNLDYELAAKELVNLSKLNKEDIKRHLSNRVTESVSEDFIPKYRSGSLVEYWSDLLVSTFSEKPNLISIDADLTYDTGTYGVKKSYPERYFQAGIAEQDMVSMAGTLALSGFVPLVHSFASFLTTRSMEQIFNNLTENTQIIYLGFLAGIIPTGPGHSHQCVTDVSMMGTLPGIKVFEPSCELELRNSLEASLVHRGPTYIRVNSLGVINPPMLFAKGQTLTERVKGKSIAIVTSGTSLTQIALEVAIELGADYSVGVFTKPELNASLSETDKRELSDFKLIICLENFLPALANYHHISEAMSGFNIRIQRIGIDEIPVNGQQDEVLKHHGLDVDSVSQKIRTIWKNL